MYSPDFDAAFPPAGQALKDAVAASDGILFVSPEYNRSIPGALKNAIDWGSRPWGTNSFARKPTGIIGASPGGIGTAVMQSSFRSVLSMEEYGSFVARVLAANAPGHIGDEHPDKDKVTR